MPIITVNMLPGRDIETKQKLIKVLTDAAVETLGVGPQTVRVLLYEVPAEHWGTGGVTKAAERAEKERKP